MPPNPLTRLVFPSTRDIIGKGPWQSMVDPEANHSQTPIAPVTSKSPPHGPLAWQWIHLPANNIHWAKSVIDKVCEEASGALSVSPEHVKAWVDASEKGKEKENPPVTNTQPHSKQVLNAQDIFRGEYWPGREINASTQGRFLKPLYSRLFSISLSYVDSSYQDLRMEESSTSFIMPHLRIGIHISATQRSSTKSDRS